MSTKKKDMFRQYISLCPKHYQNFTHDGKYVMIHIADNSPCFHCGRAGAQYSYMPKYMLARQRQHNAPPVRSRDTRAQYKGDWRESIYGNNNDSSERPEEDVLPY